MMALYYCFIFGLLLYNITCSQKTEENKTIQVEIFKNQNFNINETERNIDKHISGTNSSTENYNTTNDSNLTLGATEELPESLNETQPNRIKEDEKGVEIIQTTEIPRTEVVTILAETIVQVENESKEAEKAELKVHDTSTGKPFSPSPYLGAVIEEVIEEPIAQTRDIGTGYDFIPMRSRQNFQSFNEANQIQHEPPFYTSQESPFYSSSRVIPVQGDSYSLHEDSIRNDFENPDFNENPFGRVKFPDEKSKYFPLFLSDNEVDGRDKPLKFDFDNNYKQYDFPYKIENTGFNPEEVQKDPNISDKTHFVKGNVIINHNKESNQGTVHGMDILKNITKTLPLDNKKKKYPLTRPLTWKKVAHTFMTFLPIGLMMAAIPPRVIKANATHLYPVREAVSPLPISWSSNFKQNLNSRQSL